MAEPAPKVLVAPTGTVSPAPDGPHVEQVGWGVARQVARVLAAELEQVPTLLDDVVRLAEAPGFLAYAVFEGRTALAVALVSLPGDRDGLDVDGVAAYVGDVVVPDASPGVREALVVRALHDVANAGVAWLRVTDPQVDLRPLGFR